jgi:predicted HAD superfamily Cof-like phosphohydrolase
VFTNINMNIGYVEDFHKAIDEDEIHEPRPMK